MKILKYFLVWKKQVWIFLCSYLRVNHLWPQISSIFTHSVYILMCLSFMAADGQYFLPTL